MKTLSCIVLLLLAALPASAHHSNAEYDRTSVVELEGIIARVIWRNPHVGLELDVTNADGSMTRWVMGAADLAGTIRRGVPEGTFQAGQRVTVAGFASRVHSRSAERSSRERSPARRWSSCPVSSELGVPPPK